MRWAFLILLPLVVWYLAEYQSVTTALVVLAAVAGLQIVSFETTLERFGKLLDKANGIDRE